MLSASEPISARILVVDDDSLVRRAIVSMLELCGYGVVACEDGLAAAESVERERPDLVLLDVMMPKLNGLEVCRRIKRTAHGRSIPVVLLTARSTPEDVITGLDAGADEFLTKPIEANVLEARVRALLRFKHAMTAHHDGPSLPQLVQARVHSLSDDAGLSPREREVLDLLLLGRTMEEIALVLDIKPRTVKFHQANLLAKLGAESRLDLLRLIL